MKSTMMMTIGATYKLWCEYMKSIAQEAGVPDSYRMVLTYLLSHPEASQKEIAEYRNIKTASVSQIVKEMRLGGYLEQVPDTRDQRYVRLTLTEKGRVCAEEIQRRVALADEMLTRQMTPDGERAVMEQMDVISEIIREKLPGRETQEGKRGNGL